MIEWKQDEYSETRLLAARFQQFRRLYLYGFLFVLLVAGHGYNAYTVDKKLENFVIPIGLLCLMTIVFALSMAFGAGLDNYKSYFFNDEYIGCKNPLHRQSLKWEHIVSVETDDTPDPKIVLLTFEAQDTKLMNRMSLRVTVEKNSATHRELMAKVARMNLRVNASRFTS